MIVRFKKECPNLKEEKHKFLTHMAKYTGANIIAGDKLNKIWDNLILWAWGDEKSEYNIYKAFCFSGPVGSSKSVTLKAFGDYLSANKFILGHTNENLLINANHKPQDGKPLIFQNRINLIDMSKLKELAINDNNTNSDKVGLSYFADHYAVPIGVDEVGAGQQYFNNFGNKQNLFVEFFNRRADLNLFTHFTTNLNYEELKQFGEVGNDELIKGRFTSRLAKMNTIINFDEGIDHRGEQEIY